ncbi:hypothetical protein BGZ47_001175, partial [Haplosporangium gracile]
MGANKYNLVGAFSGGTVIDGGPWSDTVRRGVGPGGGFGAGVEGDGGPSFVASSLRSSHSGASGTRSGVEGSRRDTSESNNRVPSFALNTVDSAGMCDGTTAVDGVNEPCPTGCDPKPHGHFFEVDLFGAHLHTILDTIHTAKDGATPFELGVEFGSRMARRYGQHFAVYHVDGGRSVEKQDTHRTRAQAKEKDRSTLNTKIDLLERRCQEGKKPSKTLISDINRLVRRVYRITDEFKAEFVKGMTEAGLLVCCCITESDLCIARRPDSLFIGGLQYWRLVVSNDSDALVYRTIGRVLRKMPRSPGYGLYIKAKTVEAFNLP